MPVCLEIEMAKELSRPQRVFSTPDWATARRRRHWPAAILTHVLALVWVVWVLAPFVWLFISSISEQVELLSIPPHWWPERPTLDNYRAIFSRFLSTGWSGSQPELIWEGLLNSLYVGLLVTLFNLPLGSLAGYAFARLRFPLKRVLLGSLLFSRMVPVFAVILPFFILFRILGLLDSKLGLAIAHLAVTLPFTVWVMKGYFESIPIDLERAARIDGCSRLKALWYVTMPLARPGLIAAFIFSFMTSWNEFILALILTSSPSAMTVQPTIAGLYTITRVEYGVMMAGAALTALPPTLIALFLQRYLMQGLLSGGVRG